MSADHSQPDGSPVVLTVDNVSVSFGVGDPSVAVTEDVSFRLCRGQTLAIVGESGSGKSVTSMAIPGLLPGNATVSGSIRFGETELVGATEAVLRAVRGSKIGVVFQEPMTALNPVYTVGALIRQALGAHGMHNKAQARARAIELLDLVGIPEPQKRVDQYPHQLSGGLRQRAMIAIAISGDPEILIADEPTTALDVTVQAEILALLKSLQDRLGMSMIFITHDMGVVADVADRVCVMRSGRVVEEADVYELFERPAQKYTQRLLAAVPRLGAAQVRTDQADVTRGEHALEIENLTITYSGRFGRAGFTAVDDVSFFVPSGEIVGLVGESGSGKSTIGRAVIGLSPPTQGRIRVAGTDIAGLPRREQRRRSRAVSIVFQDPASSLNPRATIGQSVIEPLRRHGVLRGTRRLRARAAELLDSVRIPGSWTERYPHELSGGQRQRVGIARAIALAPKLLVADEPTSALDVSVQADVLELFRELQRNLGFSCLFISHDLAVVEMLASTVVVLRRGRIVESGPCGRILQDPGEEYTRQLVGAAPIPDPHMQKSRAGTDTVC